MRKNLLFYVSGIFLLVSSSFLSGQNYQPIVIQSGFSDDVIANGVGSALLSTTNGVDEVSFSYLANNFQPTAASPVLTYGLPVSGQINSLVGATPGLTFQLANYSGNNSLRLQNTSSSGTLIFTTPTAATKVFLLNTSGSGASTVSVTVNFTDATNEVFTGIIFPDWYNSTANVAIQGIGRVNRTNDVIENPANNPRMYQNTLSISSANQQKLIQNIVVTKTSTAQGVSNVFAVSVDAFSTCGIPSLMPITGLSDNSATASWSIPSGTTAASYDLYYSTTNTPPTAATVPNITGITATSQIISGLNATTTYYYWVRSNCSAATNPSVWSFSGTFTTLCGSVLPPYTNTFATIPGQCWANNLSGGSAATGPTGTTTYWQQDGFLNSGSSGAMAMNLYSTNRTGWLKTTPFNLSAGGYRVKFDYGITTYSGTATSAMGSDDIVQFLISNDGGTTWAVLQSWNVSNSPSNTLNTYSYDLQGNVNPNAVFAVYASDGTVNDSEDYNFYVDNFTVELSLSTNESEKEKVNAIYPNPFTDVLYISEIKNVKSVVIYDITGRRVKEIQNPNSAINVSEVKPGLYFVTLQYKDGSIQNLKAIKK